MCGVAGVASEDRQCVESSGVAPEDRRSDSRISDFPTSRCGARHAPRPQQALVIWASQQTQARTYHRPEFTDRKPETQAFRTFSEL